MFSDANLICTWSLWSLLSLLSGLFASLLIFFLNWRTHHMNCFVENTKKRWFSDDILRLILGKLKIKLISEKKICTASLSFYCFFMRQVVLWTLPSLSVCCPFIEILNINVWMRLTSFLTARVTLIVRKQCVFSFLYTAWNGWKCWHSVQSITRNTSKPHSLVSLWIICKVAMDWEFKIQFVLKACKISHCSLSILYKTNTKSKEKRIRQRQRKQYFIQSWVKPHPDYDSRLYILCCLYVSSACP